MRKRFVLLLISLLLIITCGCSNIVTVIQKLSKLRGTSSLYGSVYYPYFVEARYSILWCYGRVFSLHAPKAPEVQIIETDNFGRELYYYSEGYDEDHTYCTVCAYLIVQKIDNDYIYYYPEVNFLRLRVDNDGIKIDVGPDEISQLKEHNDWNKELNMTTCTQKAVSSHKEELFDNDYENILCEIQKSYGYDGGYASDLFPHPLDSDQYGRVLYSFAIFLKSDPWNDLLVIAIINPDGTYSFIDNKNGLFDYFDYDDALAALKESVHWGQKP